jgi:glycosyltransferase involved in cell wall biosynthesis
MSRSSLRCAILAVGDYPEGGATSQRLGMLARVLRDGVGETAIWIMHPSSRMAIPENEHISAERDGIRYTYLSGRTVRPAGVFPAFLDTVRGIAASVGRLAGRRSRRPDLLVLYTPKFVKFIIPLLVARLLRIPVLVEVCEVWSKSTDTVGAGVLRRLANSGEPVMERFVARVSAGLLVISQGIKCYYRELGMPEAGIYLLPVLIDAEHYEKSGDAAVEKLRGVRYLLNSGSYNEKDGLSYLIRATAGVHGDFPDIRLVFTGHAPPEVESRILDTAGEDARDWIVFTGHLSRDALIWCYKHALGLLSCRSNSEYANYGFPTKLVEYLASGTPVIVTAVGDVNGYLRDGETAYLAAPENTGSIEEAIRRLLEDPDAAAETGRAGAGVARDTFDYRVHIDGLADFIRRRAGKK